MFHPTYFICLLWFSSTLTSSDSQEVKSITADQFYLETPVVVEKAFEITIDQIVLNKTIKFFPTLTAEYNDIIIILNSTGQLRNENDNKCFEILYGLKQKTLNDGGLFLKSPYGTYKFNMKEANYTLTVFERIPKKPFVVYYKPPTNENCPRKHSTISILGIPSYNILESNLCPEAHKVKVYNINNRTVCTDNYTNPTIFDSLRQAGANIEMPKEERKNRPSDLPTWIIILLICVLIIIGGILVVSVVLSVIYRKKLSKLCGCTEKKKGGTEEERQEMIQTPPQRSTTETDETNTNEEIQDTEENLNYIQKILLLEDRWFKGTSENPSGAEDENQEGIPLTQFDGPSLVNVDRNPDQNSDPHSSSTRPVNDSSQSHETDEINTRQKILEKEKEIQDTEKEIQDAVKVIQGAEENLKNKKQELVLLKAKLDQETDETNTRKKILEKEKEIQDIEENLKNDKQELLRLKAKLDQESDVIKQKLQTINEKIENIPQSDMRQEKVDELLKSKTIFQNEEKELDEWSNSIREILELPDSELEKEDNKKKVKDIMEWSNSRSECTNLGTEYMENVEYIPERESDCDVDNFIPEGKYITDFETLGPTCKLDQKGSHIYPPEEYRDSVNTEWIKIYNTGAISIIRTVPYFAQCENSSITFIVRFSLEKHNREKFQIKAKLLPNNFINQKLKYQLPLTFRMEIQIEIGDAKMEECEFVCKELDEYSGSQLVSLVPGVEKEFPKIFIRVVDIKIKD